MRQPCLSARSGHLDAEPIEANIRGAGSTVEAHHLFRPELDTGFQERELGASGKAYQVTGRKQRPGYTRMTVE
jgi:hypothetical protein